MSKLMMLAAMVAVVMLLAAPAMADTVLRSTAQIDQSNEGDQIAVNRADQDATASQYQYQPGGSATGGDQFQYGNSLHENDGGAGSQFQYGGDVTGGDGGTGSQYQYQNQSQDQTARAIGPTFDADQDISANNRVA